RSSALARILLVGCSHMSRQATNDFLRGSCPITLELAAPDAKRRRVVSGPDGEAAWDHRPTLNRLESASQNTTLKTLNQLCRALRCGVGDLFETGQAKLRTGRARGRGLWPSQLL